MSEMRKPKIPALAPKTSKIKLTPKRSKEEELYASMAECLDVIPAEKPDPTNLNILKGKRPNIREIAWYWLPANQDNLGEPGHCRTFTIPEAHDEEITASDLSIPAAILQDSQREEVETITEPSTSAGEVLTETESDISTSLLSTDFANLTVSSKTSSDELSTKTASDEKISTVESSTSHTSTEMEQETAAAIKKTRFKNLPSIEKSIVSAAVEEENPGGNIPPIGSSEKFISQNLEHTGNYKLDKFTHGFYQLLESEEGQSPKALFSKELKNDPQPTSESEFTSCSFETLTDTAESFHLMDVAPINPPLEQVSEKSPERSNRSAAPTIDKKQEINFNVDLISARSEEPTTTKLISQDDQLYVCGNYSIYPITELTEPSSCNSDFEEPLAGFDEFNQNNPKKMPKSTSWDVDISSITKSHQECVTESEYETTENESTDSETDNKKLQMFSMQELEKFPSNKIGIRFKRILKVNGKHIFDCKCNYHLLPARYQKKYRNPENLLLEFNHLLLPSDQTVYFSSHYCPYTIQEMNDIMEITGGLKYLPQSYIMQYIMHNKYKKPSKKFRMRSTPYLEKKEMVVSLIQRPSVTEIPGQDETLITDDPLNSPVVLPPLEERLANRSKRPVTRRWDSEIKRPSE